MSTHAAIAFLAIATLASADDRCDRVPAKAASEIEAYVAPPQYSTRNGWTFAQRLEKIPRGAAILICERKWVGFIGARTLWLRVRFDGTKEGWIAGEGSTSQSLRRVFVSDAQAQEADPGLPGKPSEIPVFVLSFAAMLFGMLGKGIFDHVQRGIHLRQYLRDTGRALIVSPIVFLSLAKVGDFQFEPTVTSLGVFLCMAFQNGFFWQTVLVKAGEAPEPDTNSMAIAAR